MSWITGFIRHLKTILVLPFTVLVIIPGLIIYFSPVWNLSYVLGSSSQMLYGIGLLAFFISSAFFVSTLVLFIRISEGTLAPWDPSQKLVVRGYYRHLRNPMILGIVALLFSEALIFDSLLIMIWCLLFVLINHLYFIRKEEPDLLKRFGEEYRIYQQNVPRWWPRRQGWRPEDE